jgi:hypothetical protein
VTDGLSTVVVTQPERANGKIAAGGAIEIIGAAAADIEATKVLRLVILNLSDQVRSTAILKSEIVNVVDPGDTKYDIRDH